MECISKELLEVDLIVQSKIMGSGRGFYIPISPAVCCMYLAGRWCASFSGHTGVRCLSAYFVRYAECPCSRCVAPSRTTDSSYTRSALQAVVWRIATGLPFRARLCRRMRVPCRGV